MMIVFTIQLCTPVPNTLVYLDHCQPEKKEKNSKEKIHVISHYTNVCLAGLEVRVYSNSEYM